MLYLGIRILPFQKSMDGSLFIYLSGCFIPPFFLSFETLIYLEQGISSILSFKPYLYFPFHQLFNGIKIDVY